jgi:hypothetical protein
LAVTLSDVARDAITDTNKIAGVMMQLRVVCNYLSSSLHVSLCLDEQSFSPKRGNSPQNYDSLSLALTLPAHNKHHAGIPTSKLVYNQY